MILNDINLFRLANELGAADLGIVSPFYTDDAAFDGSARRSAQLLKLLMDSGMDQGLLP